MYALRMVQQSARSYKRQRAVRGPFVNLAPHADHCETREDLKTLCMRLRKNNPEVLLAADLFSGAGGLSLGLEQAGATVVFAADHDEKALETHRHHMAGMAVNWDLSDPVRVQEVAEILGENSIDILAGGPPCQPFSLAGRSRIKALVREGVRERYDRRRDLWRSFLEVALVARPRAVVMENVPDMVLDSEMFILRSMALELESAGYMVHSKVLEAWRHGVPQLRNRLFLVALRDGNDFDWPGQSGHKVTLSNAISDLPPVKGGWRPTGGAEGWSDYAGPRTSYQTEMRKGVSAKDSHKIYDHITRPVRDDDMEAFELLDAESSYSDLPSHLKRYRDDIFNDKYKRLDGHDVSRTITAHIAKDGYWYIHPEQNRTLTLREAARVQSFPDWFRFAGAPSNAFRQIGNAVPPKLGEAVTRAAVTALNNSRSDRPRTEVVSNTLVNWFNSRTQSSSPWFHANSNWDIMVGELLLGKTSTLVANSLWPLLGTEKGVRGFLDSQAEVELALSWIGRGDKFNIARTIAERLAEQSEISDKDIDALVSDGLLSSGIGDVAKLGKSEGQEPITATSAALRVASRFNRNDQGRRNIRTDGRIAVANMVGYGPQARVAHLALLELGADICTPAAPACGECPLATWCLSAPLYLAQRSSELANSG